MRWRTRRKVSLDQSLPLAVRLPARFSSAATAASKCSRDAKDLAEKVGRAVQTSMQVMINKRAPPTDETWRPFSRLKGAKHLVIALFQRPERGERKIFPRPLRVGPLGRRYNSIDKIIPSLELRMPIAISLRLPFETGTRLQNLADTLGATVTDAVATLLDHGARTGLGNTLALPGIEITCKADQLVHIKIDGIALRPQTASQAQSFAGSLRCVATSARPALDMDCPDMIEVTRRGNGIVVSVHRDGVTIVCRVYARGVAKAMADQLEQAAAEALTAAEPLSAADLASVDQLLGDLEIGAEAEPDEDIMELLGELGAAD